MNPKFIKVDTVGVDQPVHEGAYQLLKILQYLLLLRIVIVELHPFALEKMEHSQETLRTYMEKYCHFSYF